MFATGKAFPVRFYDPDLSATEQGILVGMYRIEQQAQQDALKRNRSMRWSTMSTTSWTPACYGFTWSTGKV
jgi:hypothetical protein